MTETVRTRFAPSPTGDMHLGSVRTALYNYLFAKKNHGVFLLRIEDTDQERSTEAATQVILSGLEWLGLTHSSSDPIVYQSQRFDRYRAVAEKLLNNQQAYRCDCSTERLEELRKTQLAQKQKPRYDGCCRHKTNISSDQPHVIRFKMPDPETGSVAFVDLIHGLITVSHAELDDLVLIRSNRTPTYNFCVVIDDLDQQITHVIRGDDHINNTPRQILLYQALGAPLPKFAHIPMILDESGKKMSKRHAAASILKYRDQGYLPEALLNYLVRLGWSSGDQEIFSHSELIEKFDLSGVHSSPARFDLEKLNWLNQAYLKTQSISELKILIQNLGDPAVLDQVIKLGIDLDQFLSAYQTRVVTGQDLIDILKIYTRNPLDYNQTALDKFCPPEKISDIIACLDNFQTILKKSPELLDQPDLLNQQLKTQIQNYKNLAFQNIGQAIRLALTGDIHTPMLGVTMKFVGLELCQTRLDDFIKKWRS